MYRWWVAVVAPVLCTAVMSGAVRHLPAEPENRPWVVSVGDSYISGEAGRWAGNADHHDAIDALGGTAYDDSPAGESIPGCHRSRSAEIVIGVVDSLNLACSGASTDTSPYRAGHTFTPGLDFYDDGAGHLGQAAALRTFASRHRVAMVAVSVGGDEFDFAGIVRSCVTDFLISPFWWKNFCHDDSSVRSKFTEPAVAAAQVKIETALRNVQQAMAEAGEKQSDYTVVVQTYPSPLPSGSALRYSEHGFGRQRVGGCGFWNQDADWANSTVLPTINGVVRAAVADSGLPNVTIMEVESLFDGHRLCEKSDHKLQEAGYTSWRQPGAADVSEWVENIRTVTAALGPYDVEESLHPNYWGQLALRDCLRQAWNDGAVRGGTCRSTGPGQDDRGEPLTTLS